MPIVSLGDHGGHRYIGLSGPEQNYTTSLSHLFYILHHLVLLASLHDRARSFASSRPRIGVAGVASSLAFPVSINELVNSRGALRAEAQDEEKNNLTIHQSGVDLEQGVFSILNPRPRRDARVTQYSLTDVALDGQNEWARFV